jgi:hypothetical protein
MNHYHIRWANSKLDWEAFRTKEEARTEAERLKHPGEEYLIEELDGECVRCKEIKPKSARSQVATEGRSAAKP